MSVARVLRTCMLTSLLISASGAQDIIQGDIPAGPPFDGTGDRASMFDLYKIATITSDVALAQSRDPDMAFFSVLEATLSAKGYPGTRFLRLAQGESFASSCSPDGVIEVRVQRHAARNDVAVEVASQYWFSHGREAQDSTTADEIYARDCIPL